MKTKIIVPLMTLLLASTGFAADTEVSRENRQKMSELHMKMADCLKSDRPLGECNTEMMQNCDMMGKDGCGMMGPMHGRMKDSKKKPSTKK